jgi:hypothetical protein
MEQTQRDEREFGPRLGSMLDAYADGLPAPATDLVSGGLARGRRFKRRRQTLWGAAAFTVTAGLAGGAVLAGLIPGGSGAGTANQATGPAAVTVPDFSLAAARASAPAGKVAVTGKATVATLRDLLPGEPATSGYRWWEGKEGADSVRAGGRLLIQADGGKAETTVSLQGSFQLTAFDALSKDAAREAAAQSGQQAQEQDKSGRAAPDKPAAAKEATGSETTGSDATGSEKKGRPATKAELQSFYSCAARTETGVSLTSCRARNLDDGAILITYEEKSGPLTRRTADLLRTDGTRIVLVTSNSTDSKHGPADVSTPFLTSAELTRIAESTDWRPWVDPSVNDGAKSIS